MSTLRNKISIVGIVNLVNKDEKIFQIKCKDSGKDFVFFYQKEDERIQKGNNLFAEGRILSGNNVTLIDLLKL